MTDASAVLSSEATRDAHRLAARLGRGAPVAAVTLGIFVLLVSALPKFLDDPDTQWHVATGRWIWANRSVPTSDIFSHTFAGMPWIAKEWFSQLLLFWAFAADGWRGVDLIATAVVAATYGMLFSWLAKRLRLSASLAFTFLAVFVAAPHLLARPHALVLPIIVLFATQLMTAIERRKAPPLRLALLMIAWTNMHGSFPLGLALAVLAGAEGILMRPSGSRIEAARGWGAFLAVAGAASLASPYGLDAVLIPLKMGGNTAVPYLDEWQPLGFDPCGCLALGLFAFSVMVLCLDLRSNFFRLAAILLFGCLMVRHSRFVDLFGLLAPILITGALAARLRLSRDSDEPFDDFASVAATSVATALAITACIAVVRSSPKPASTVMPAAALHAAVAQGVSGPVYNEYAFGGFLIANGIKTFIDGRSDQLFTGDFLPNLERSLDEKAHEDFGAILTRYRVRWALVKKGSRDERHLSALTGWSKLYEDDIAVVFAVAPLASMPPVAGKIGSTT